MSSGDDNAARASRYGPVAKNNQSPRGFGVPRGRGCTTGMIVSWNLYEGVSVIDHCSHCTGVDENLEDVVVTREQSAPGLHRSTSPVETLNPADTRSPCGHCFYRARKGYICHCGNLLVLQARLQWIWKWGTKRVTEGWRSKANIQGKQNLLRAALRG